MRREKKRRKERILAAALAVLTAAMFAACGKEEKEDGSGEFVYVPEYVDLNGDEEIWYPYVKDYVYAQGVFYFTAYDPNEEGYALCCYDLAAKTLEKRKVPETTLLRLAADEEGNLYVTYVQSAKDNADAEDIRMERGLLKYDSGMNRIYKCDLAERLKNGDEYDRIESVALDREGHAYLSVGNKVFLLDEDGKYRGVLELDGTAWIQGLAAGRDGKVCANYYGVQGSGMEVVELDYTGMTAEKVHKVSGLSDVGFRTGVARNFLAAGVDKNFLVRGADKLYEYDTDTDTAVEVLDWSKCNVNGPDVDYVCPMEDGGILVVVRDGAAALDLVILRKDRASEAAEKEEIVVGVFNAMDSDFQSAVVAFNKSSDKYHVSIRDYAGGEGGGDYRDQVARLNSDIVSKDNCPDLVEAMVLDVGRLSKQGAFEDLRTWLEKSEVLGEGSFIESVLNAYTYDGRLICIPKKVSFDTLAGKKSLLGDAEGWTPEEFMALAEEHPDAELIEHADRSNMMMVLMAYNQDAFIDWEKGTCSFDSEEFIRLLEFVGSLPEERREGDGVDTRAKMESGRLLLTGVGMHDVEELQDVAAVFSEMTCIGYPTPDGSGGGVLRATVSLAMMSRSRHKEGAWSFLEYYLNRESEEGSTWGLPSNRKQFDALVGKKLNAEEVDAVLALLGTARPLPMGNLTIYQVIEEEAEAFYQGDKSAAEAAGLIQRRASVYVSENE